MAAVSLTYEIFIFLDLNEIEIERSCPHLTSNTLKHVNVNVPNEKHQKIEKLKNSRPKLILIFHRFLTHFLPVL